MRRVCPLLPPPAPCIQLACTAPPRLPSPSATPASLPHLPNLPNLPYLPYLPNLPHLPHLPYLLRLLHLPHHLGHLPLGCGEAHPHAHGHGRSRSTARLPIPVPISNIPMTIGHEGGAGQRRFSSKRAARTVGLASLKRIRGGEGASRQVSFSPGIAGAWAAVGTPSTQAPTTTKSGVVRRARMDRGPERLAKHIARSGLCSRREAERMIAKGLVTVEGAQVVTPAAVVSPGAAVRIANKLLPEVPDPHLWLHYKKRYVVVTHNDREGRVALFPHLQKMGLPYLISVGRLDYESEGLLVLTNNGHLARYLEHPSNCIERKYRARIRGRLSQDMIEKMKRGMRVDGQLYAPMYVSVLRKQGASEGVAGQTGANQWLEVSVAEGKNREVRKVLEKFGLVVTRLIRTKYGPFELPSKLLPGDVLEARLPRGLMTKAETFWWRSRATANALPPASPPTLHGPDQVLLNKPAGPVREKEGHTNK